MARKPRADDIGQHRTAFDKNRKKILLMQDVCGICGLPVDKSLKFPHPLSPTVDHIIPINLGGHPSDFENLQLAHFTCNRQKSDKILEKRRPSPGGAELTENTDIQWSRDWTKYTG